MFETRLGYFIFYVGVSCWIRWHEEMQTATRLGIIGSCNERCGIDTISLNWLSYRLESDAVASRLKMLCEYSQEPNPNPGASAGILR